MSNPDFDPFAVEHPEDFADPQGVVERDKKTGRPILPHPETGKLRQWSRPSKLASELSNPYNLTRWEIRQVMRGIATNSDLRALVATAEWPAETNEQKDALNKIAHKAKDRMATDAKANEGTARHSLYAAYFKDPAGWVDNPQEPAFNRDLHAVRTLFAEQGYITHPDMIERMVVTPGPDGRRINAAGTFDYGLQRVDASGALAWAKPRIGDVKTGIDEVEWKGLSDAIQFAIYANGVAMVPRDWRGRYEPTMVDFDKDIATMIHVPLGEGRAAIYDVNIAAGWEAALFILDLRAWRNRKDFFTFVAGWGAGTPTPIVAAQDPADPIMHVVEPMTVFTGEPGPELVVDQGSDVYAAQTAAVNAALGADETPAGPPEGGRWPRRKKTEIAADDKADALIAAGEPVPVELRRACSGRKRAELLTNDISARVARPIAHALDALDRMSAPVAGPGIAAAVEAGEQRTAQQIAEQNFVVKSRCANPNCREFGHVNCGKKGPLAIDVRPDAYADPEGHAKTGDEPARVIDSVTPLYVNLDPATGTVSTIVRDNGTGGTIEVPGGQLETVDLIAREIDKAANVGDLATLYQMATDAGLVWTEAHTARGLRRFQPVTAVDARDDMEIAIDNASTTVELAELYAKHAEHWQDKYTQRGIDRNLPTF